MKSAGDVDINELLPTAQVDMRLVQRRRVQNRVDAGHVSLHEGSVGDRSDLAGERRLCNIQPDDLVRRRLERPHQRFTEMSRAACN
jgi:hypothetical protein